jgi:hypothetical protein
VPKKLYRNERLGVCPLDNDIEAVFDPARIRIRAREAERWVLYDDGDNLAGRVAAFYDTDCAIHGISPLRHGFFECINDRDSAFLLFDTAQEWLKSKGMEAMDVPKLRRE